jgi:hypothetical protein
MNSRAPRRRCVLSPPAASRGSPSRPARRWTALLSPEERRRVMRGRQAR